MWFGLLGTLLAREDDERVVPIAGARQQVLLAALLVRVTHVVAADELIEMLWDGAPPAGARVSLRSYVKRLRHGLGPQLGSRILTRPAGYAIDLDDDELDLQQFDILRSEGNMAIQAGAWNRASEKLGQALVLWRGHPLVDVPCEVLRSVEVPRLEECRLQAVEDRVTADLRTNRLVGLVGELQGLTAAHPLRESFHSQLIVALYRTGRRAEALAAYERARQTLIAELGVGPGAELRQLHYHILAEN